LELPRRFIFPAMNQPESQKDDSPASQSEAPPTELPAASPTPAPANKVLWSPQLSGAQRLIWLVFWTILLLLFVFIPWGDKDRTTVVFCWVFWILLALGAGLPCIHERKETLPSREGEETWSVRILGLKDRRLKHKLGTSSALLHSAQFTIAFTILFSAFFNGSFSGRYLARYGYDALTHSLPEQDIQKNDVVVIDTSSLPTILDATRTADVADIADLKPFVKHLIEDKANRPLCVAIDINFHQFNVSQPYVRPEDPAILTEWLGATQAEDSLPIFVAIKRFESRAKRWWLPANDLESLATSANLTAKSGDMSHLWARYSIEGGESGRGKKPEYVETLGQRVAKVPNPPTENDLIVFKNLPGTQRYGHAEVHAGAHGVLNGDTVFVDYRPLPALLKNKLRIEDFIKDGKNRASQEDWARLRQKYLLLGDVSRPDLNDIFTVPGTDAAYPGVILHAGLASSLLYGKIVEVTPLASVLADTLMAFVLLYLLHYIASLNPNKEWDPVAQNVVTILIALLPIGLALLLAQLGILWPEAFLVSFAMLLGLPFETAVSTVSANMHALEEALTRPRGTVHDHGAPH
jgi:hypothetical protein